jgi:hypothetical protein
MTKIALSAWFLDSLHKIGRAKGMDIFYPDFHDLDLQCMFSIPCVGPMPYPDS